MFVSNASTKSASARRSCRPSSEMPFAGFSGSAGSANSGMPYGFGGSCDAVERHRDGRLDERRPRVKKCSSVAVGAVVLEAEAAHRGRPAGCSGGTRDARRGCLVRRRAEHADLRVHVAQVRDLEDLRLVLEREPAVGAEEAGVRRGRRVAVADRACGSRCSCGSDPTAAPARAVGSVWLKKNARPAACCGA